MMLSSGWVLAVAGHTYARLLLGGQLDTARWESREERFLKANLGLPGRRSIAKQESCQLNASCKRTSPQKINCLLTKWLRLGG